MVSILKKISSKIYFGIFILLIVILWGFYFKKADGNLQQNNNLLNDSIKKQELMTVNLSSRINKLNEFNYNDYFTVGWIQVQGTNIDFPIFTPIVKSLEENGDINPDFSYGWRHINYTLGENRMVLSAHNLINVSSKPIINSDNLSDFEALMSFVYHEFAKENQYIMYTDEDGNENLYVIYAVGFTNFHEEEYYSIKYEDKDKLDEYLTSAKENSIYDYTVSVNNNDDIISLITCTRFFGIDGDTLFRVDARKIRENEDTYKYKVNTNKNYNDVYKKLNEEDI